MSSVGRSGSDDNKYIYDIKAAQKEKANSEKIKDLQAGHAEDLTRVTNESKASLEQMRDRYQTKMSQQDQKHLEEIESLKALYHRKLAERE